MKILLLKGANIKLLSNDNENVLSVANSLYAIKIAKILLDYKFPII